MTRKEQAIERAKRLYDALLEEEAARGILPAERRLLDQMK
jgi:hypothetical protein